MSYRNRVYTTKPKIPDYVPVITLLEPEERGIVNIKSQGFFERLDRNNVQQIMVDVEEGRTGTILVSLSRRMSNADLEDFKHISLYFPAIRLVGFVHNNHYVDDIMINTLNLGDCGMKMIVKSNRHEDWFNLRAILSKSSDEHIRVIACKKILGDLEGAPPDCLRFFSTLFERNFYVSNITHFCHYLGVNTGTLNTRFRRCRLPSPKDYMVYSRLIRVASLLEPEGAFANTVAIRLGYSSAQMFQRHLKKKTGMSSRKFREVYNGEKMLDYFRKKFIIPYVEVLREFRPLKP